MSICFLIRDRRGVDLDGKWDGEELGGVKGWEMIIRIYYVENLFLVKEKSHTLNTQQCAACKKFSNKATQKYWKIKNKNDIPNKWEPRINRNGYTYIRKGWLERKIP